VAARAVTLGHQVTCLARGQSGAATDGAKLVTGDRSQPGGYDGLPDQGWDLVVDVSSQPGYVRSAVRALADRARRWVYVSSLSVYRDNSEPGADESAEILPALDSDQATIEQYGEGKVACEERAQRATGPVVRGPARTDLRIRRPERPVRLLAGLRPIL
jgi:nucleoside-diphosphate-sugar epimerase